MKLDSKSRKACLLIGLLGLLVLLSVGVTLWPQPPSSGLTIQFVGFTNVAGQPSFAVFGVTNLSRKSMTFAPAQPQVRTGGVWSGAVVVRPPAIGIALRAGWGTNVSVDLPDHAEAWRMPVVWGYDLNKWEFYVQRSKNLLRTAQHGSLSGWREGFGVNGYTNFSAEIESTKAEPDGAANGSQPIRSETNSTPSAAGSRR
jgi:hypothetical protein